MLFASLLNVGKFFYDKEIDVLNNTQTTTADGQIQEEQTKVDTIYGNLQYSMSENLQKSYGLKTTYSVYVTTDDVVEIGQYLRYDGILYEVVDVRKRDTHNLIVANNVTIN